MLYEFESLVYWSSKERHLQSFLSDTESPPKYLDTRSKQPTSVHHAHPVCTEGQWLCRTALSHRCKGPCWRHRDPCFHDFNRHRNLCEAVELTDAKGLLKQSMCCNYSPYCKIPPDSCDLKWLAPHEGSLPFKKISAVDNYSPSEQPSEAGETCICVTTTLRHPQIP